MFGIGPMELVVIAIAAVVLVGPQKLPEVMRQLGKFFVQARRYSNDVKTQMQTVIDEAEQELRMEELEKLRHEINSAVALPEVAATTPSSEPPGAVSTSLDAEFEARVREEFASTEHHNDPYLRGETPETPPAELSTATAEEKKTPNPASHPSFTQS